MATTAEFWDNLAEKYAADPIKDMASYEHTIDRVRSYLHAGDVVLEVGCGTGSTALLLADTGATITGTDISGGMISIANRKLASEGLTNVSFHTQPANWTEPDKQYDAILSFNLLHLVKETEDTVAKLASALKPGGLMITKTPCLRGNPIYPILIGAMRLIGKAPYVRMFSPAQVDEMFRAEGLEILETGQFPKKPPSHFVVARKASS